MIIKFNKESFNTLMIIMKRVAFFNNIIFVRNSEKIIDRINDDVINKLDNKGNTVLIIAYKNNMTEVAIKLRQNR